MEIRDILDGQPVDLDAMLAEREARAAAQRRWLSVGKTPLVCLSINMAGPVKTFPLLRHTYRQGRRLTEDALRRLGASWELLEERLGPCGPFALYAVRGQEKAVKAALCAVEDGSPGCRLLDLDVLGQNGEKLSRQDEGHPPRRCLLCGEAAAVCGRSRRHSVEDLQREAVRRMLADACENWADRVSSQAARAMLYEVAVTPKPGLVDRWSSGAHGDMDFFTFLDSAAALLPWFRRFCLLGLQQADLSDESLFAAARELGRQAEDAMFAATGGVNTHKGLIFSLGLLCTAAGQLHLQALLAERGPSALSEAALRRRAADLASFALPDLRGGAADTNGQRVFRAYQAAGVRQEAAAGFPAVETVVLPALNGPGTLEERGRRALLALFCTVEDTNVLHRGGPSALQTLQTEASRLLQTPPENPETALAALDAKLTCAGISPGGCADLLAVGYFLWFLSSPPEL